MTDIHVHSGAHPDGKLILATTCIAGTSGASKGEIVLHDNLNGTYSVYMVDTDNSYVDLTDSLGLIPALSAWAKFTAGQFVLACAPLTATSSAATVTAGAAGAITKSLTWTLKVGAALQTWFNGPITLIPAKTTNSSAIGLPVVTGGNTVQLVGGTATTVLTYDTDAGATKTYIATDTVGVTATIPTIFGTVPTVTAAGFLDTLAA
jgi:hypothetical protein